MRRAQHDGEFPPPCLAILHKGGKLDWVARQRGGGGKGDLGSISLSPSLSFSACKDTRGGLFLAPLFVEGGAFTCLPSIPTTTTCVDWRTGKKIGSRLPSAVCERHGSAAAAATAASDRAPFYLGISASSCIFSANAADSRLLALWSQIARTDQDMDRWRLGQGQAASDGRTKAHRTGHGALQGLRKGDKDKGSPSPPRSHLSLSHILMVGLR